MRLPLTSLINSSLVLAILISPTEARPGNVIQVPGNASTIQGGVDLAMNGDTVVVGPGTYTKTTGSSSLPVVDVSFKEITIRSSGGPEITIIDGLNQRRAFRFNGGNGPAMIVQGFTMMRCKDSDGGAILFDGSTTEPIVRDCVLRDNWATSSGGALYARNGASPSFFDCLLIDNTADNDGGAVGCIGVGSDPVFRDCEFLNNTAWDAGGAIWCDNSAAPEFFGCTLRGNISRSLSKGGGMLRCLDNSRPAFDSCFVLDNTATNDGGAVSAVQQAIAAFTNCVISENTATLGDGGAIYFAGANNGIATITGCTIAHNSAGNRGGGIYCDNKADISIEGSIVWGNSAPNGTQVYLDGANNDLYYKCSILNISIIPGGGTQHQLGTMYSVDPQFCLDESPTFRMRTGPKASSPALPANRADTCGVFGALTSCNDTPVPVDLQLYSIDSIPDSSREGEEVTPEVRVAYLSGDFEKTFSVTLTIGDNYTETVTDSLEMRRSGTLTFPAWTAEAGAQVVTATINEADSSSENNTRSDTIYVEADLPVDIAVTEILAPTGTAVAGSSITPKAVVNYVQGDSTRTTSFRMWVGLDSFTVMETLDPGETDTLNFDSWTAYPGSLTVRCRALSGDADSTNNEASNSVVVPEIHDIVLRSGIGEIGSFDPIVNHTTVPNSNTPFSQADFENARTGPDAFIIETNSAWDADIHGIHPEIHYIIPIAGSAITSNLFAVDFEVEGPVGSAGFMLRYAVDNNLGDGSRPGIYINETPVSAPGANGGFETVTEFSADVGPLLRDGTNTLYLYNYDWGIAWGLAFEATFDITPLEEEPGPSPVLVHGKRNIWGAGHVVPPNPGGGNRGYLPVEIPLDGSPTAVEFPQVTGTVRADNDFSENGPDGFSRDSTSISSYGGISGIRFIGRAMFLAGVFVSDSTPADPAPATLDFSDAGLTDDFTELSPALHQVFFIGDGRAGANVIQRFIPPPGATRLCLGFPDASFFHGPPGHYGENSGELGAQVVFDHGIYRDSVIFYEDFDAENNQNAAFRYNSFAQWDVLEGWVDLIGISQADSFPGNGMYVDLDGGSLSPGRITTKDPLRFTPGTYELSFLMAGGTVMDKPDTVDVSIPGLYGERLIFPYRHPLTTYSRTLTVNSETASSLEFKNLGPDHLGALLMEVQINHRSGVVPTEPNLAVEHLSHPGSAHSEEKVAISYRVTNDGNEAATGPWTDSIYVTSDLNNRGPAVAHLVRHSALSPETKYTGNLVISLPEGESGSLWVVVCTDRANEVLESDEGDNCRASTTPIVVTATDYPDLVASNIQVSQSELFIGNLAAISWTVENRGSGDTDSPTWRDRVYLSTDQILDDEDVEVGDSLNPMVLLGSETKAFDGYTQTNALFKIPAEVGTGNRYVIVKTDQFNEVHEGPFEDNNTAVSNDFITVGEKFSKLEVQQVRIDPSQGWTGHDVTITWVVKNTGTGRVARAPYRSGFYLSTDTLFDEGDDLLVSTNLLSFAQIDTGESDTSVANITLPDQPIGELFAFVEPDVDRLASNFQAPGYAPFEIHASSLPDLVVQSAAIQSDPGTIVAGESIDLLWSVLNEGSGPTRSGVSWLDRVFLTPSDSLVEDEIVLESGAYHNGIVVPDSSYERSLSLFLPSNLSGTYYLHARTDADSVVSESQDAQTDGEQNNDRLFTPAPFEILEPVPADLEISAITVPTSLKSGDKTPITWTVHNIGEGDAKGTTWVDVVHLSRDMIVDSDDLKLVSHARYTKLEAGSLYTIESEITVPFDSTGAFQILVSTDAGNYVFEEGRESNNIDTTSVAVTRPLPADLDVVSITPQLPAMSGAELAVEWKVRNDGQEEARPDYWYDRIDLVTSSGAKPAEVLASSLFRHADSLPAGDTYEAEAILRIPDGVEGAHHLYVTSDIHGAVWEDGATSNNTETLDVELTLAPPADLRAKGIDAPDSARTGQSVTVEWQIKNVGDGEIPGVYWTDAVYLSDNATLEPAGDLLLRKQVESGPLQRSTAYARNVEVYLPPGWEGDKYLILAANIDGGAYEHVDSASNTAYRAIELKASPVELPDFAISSFAADTSGNELRGHIDVSWTITNVGEFDTPPGGSWTDRFYLSRNTTLDGNDVRIGEVARAADLGVGDSYSESTRLAIPTDSTGNFSILLVTDANDRVKEDNESNNDSLHGVTLLPVRADLDVTSVIAADEALSGQETTVQWAVRNNGDDETPASTWADRVFLSRDQVLDGSDELVAYSRRQGSLTPGGSYNVTITINIPLGFSGNYYIFVSTDDFDEVTEEDESNNTDYDMSGLLVTMPRPTDLLAESIEFPEADSGTAGELLTVAWTVANRSQVPVVGRWEDRVFLSADTTWDLGDPPIGTLMHTGGLPAGATHKSSISIARDSVDAILTKDLPGAVPGDYHAIVRVDSRNQINESNNRNNTGSSEDSLGLEIHELLDGVATSDTAGPGQNRYFRFELLEEAPVEFRLDLGRIADQIFLAVSHGGIPSLADAQYEAVVTGDSVANVNVPFGTIGNYYLLVRVQDGADTPLPFAMVADVLDFSVTEVTPPAVGTGNRSTIRISGTGFRGSMDVELVNGDTRFPAESIYNITEGAIHATFDLVGAATGWYDIVLRQSSLDFHSVTLDPDLPIDVLPFVRDTLIVPGGILVEPNNSEGIDYQISVPRAVSPGEVYAADMLIENLSNHDETPPILVVYTNPNTRLYAPSDPTARSGPLFLVPSSKDGPHGILAGGMSRVFPMRVRAPELEGVMHVNVATPGDLELPFDQDSLIAALGFAAPHAQHGEIVELLDDHGVNSWEALEEFLASTLSENGSFGSEVYTLSEAMAQALSIALADTTNSSSPRLASELDTSNRTRGEDPFPCGWEAYPSDKNCLTGGRDHPSDICGTRDAADYISELVEKYDRWHYWFFASCARRHVLKFLNNDNDCVDYPETGSPGFGCEANTPVLAPIVPPGIIPPIELPQCNGPYVANTLKGTRGFEKFHDKATSKVKEWIKQNAASLSAGSIVDWSEIPGWDKAPESGDAGGRVAISKWLLRCAVHYIPQTAPLVGCSEQEDLFWAFGDIEEGTGYVEIVSIANEGGSCKYGIPPARTVRAKIHYRFCDYYRFNPHKSTCPEWTAQSCWPSQLANFEMSISLTKDVTFELPTDEIIDPCDFGDDGEEVAIVRPIDPNEKHGPTAEGESPYVSVADPIPYTILFENLPEASAPAQIVTILDTLDEDIDLRSFRLGPMIVAGEVISDPPNQGYWQDEIELDSGLLLRINAGLDVRDRVAEWCFETVDPTTGFPPADPLAGFLPPNDPSSGSGEGQVSYAVRPLASVESGTEINNKALIVFNGLEAIETNVVTNFVETNLPDLVVKEISTVSDGLGLVEGDTTEFIVVIGNDGTRQSDAVDVYLLDGHPDDGWIGLDTASIPDGIPPGGEAEAIVSWDPDRIRGEHELYILVEGGDAIEDISDENNLRRVEPEVEEREFRIEYSGGITPVSIPVEPEIPPSAEWLADQFDADVVVAVDSNGVFEPYFPENPDASDFELTGDRGYFVITSSSGTVKIQGITNIAQSHVGSGLNFLSLPVDPGDMLYARDWAEMLNASMIVKLVPETGEFLPFLPDEHDGPGYLIEGGVGYLVMANEDRTVVYHGAGWFGGHDLSRAGSAKRTENQPLPMFGITGRAWEASSSKDGSTRKNWSVAIENRRTGASVTSDIDGESGSYGAIFVDFQGSDLVKQGDRLEVAVRDEKGHPIGESAIHVVTEEDAASYYVNLGNLAALTVPRSTFAHRNAPNPFNGVTSIRYQLSKKAQVSLRVFTVAGREVKTLINKTQEPGYYTVDWDGKNGSGRQVASGVYFYRFTTPDFSTTQKMVIVR